MKGRKEVMLRFAMSGRAIWAVVELMVRFDVMLGSALRRVLRAESM